MHIVGRRNFLAGVGLGAGSHLLGGIFKSLLPEALGASSLRKRLTLFTGANGFLEKFYTCASRTETDFDLSPVFQPVAAYKAKMVIASKFFNPFSKALHGNQHATLTVKESTKPGVAQERGPPGGISIDRLLAREIGSGDAFSSTASGRGICVSADGPGQSFPSIGSPGQAFDTWFGGGAAPAGGGLPAGDGLEVNFARKRSFLDVLRADIGRMNARLAGTERAKLDQYLESLRTLEQQLAQRGMAGAGCQKGARPADGANLGDTLTAHVDVVLAAQRCGLTRVSHVLFEGMEGPHIVYNWLQDPRNHHDDHHASDTPILLKIATWWFTTIGRMVSGLANTPEGNGTMLDNSLVVFINTCGGTHHRGQETHPVVMFGSAGGALRTGRYLTYPQGQRCMSDFYVSLANMFDVPLTTFGDPSVCKGPLPGLV
jgi:uncharacterized protein DUF1552